MRATITMVHSSGVQVAVLVDDLAQVDEAIQLLLGKGYRPTGSAGDGWQRTPDGRVICAKHQTAMTLRSKQQQEWWSHRIVAGTGEELYCRGYRHGPADKDGWLVDAPA
jgi:hypothetical protein